MLIASIDPHKAKLAIAEWSGNHLRAISLLRGDLSILTKKISGLRYDLIVIETPQIYPNMHGKDPNDLLAVAKAVGLCYTLAPTVIEYLPRQWKGQVPKNTHHMRVKDGLTLNELNILGRDQPDILDAIGIGLRYLGRL